MGFQADLHSTALLKLIKTKLPDNFLMKWTKYAVRENDQNNNVQLFQEWLEIQAKVLERLQGEHSFLGTSAVKDQELMTQNQTSLGSKQKTEMGSDINLTTKFQYPSKKCFDCSQGHCPRYQSLAPVEKNNLVKQHELCINSLSSRHSRNNCTSERRCQQFRGFHHTSLHDPSRFTSKNSASYAAIVSGKNEDDKEFTTATSSRYDQSHSIDKNTYHQQKQADSEIHFFKNEGFTASEKATFERLPNIWFEQLQLIPVSFVNNGKVCDTYALIDPGSQLTFMLDQIADFLEISSSETANMSSQYININHEMPVAKLDNIVNLAPYKQTGQTFPIRNVYKTPFLNIPPADVAHLNEICQGFKGFRHIKFPNIAGGRIGALLGVNTFSYKYPIQVIEGNDCRPHGIQTRLGWTIAGEYHQTIAPTRLNKVRNRQTSGFVFHVTRKSNESAEHPLDYLVQKFWKIGETGQKQQKRSFIPKTIWRQLGSLKTQYITREKSMKLVYRGRMRLNCRITTT